MAAHAGTVLNVAVSSEKGLPCPVPSSANNGSSRTSSLTRHQKHLESMFGHYLLEYFFNGMRRNTELCKSGPLGDAIVSICINSI
jgi:hypothetical protein